MRQDCKATVTTCSSTFQRKMYYPGPHRLWRAVVRPCRLLLPAGKLETVEALGCVFPRPASCLCVPVSQSTISSTTTNSFPVDLVSSLKSCDPWTDSLSSFPMFSPQKTQWFTPSPCLPRRLFLFMFCDVWPLTNKFPEVSSTLPPHQNALTRTLNVRKWLYVARAFKDWNRNNINFSFF